MSNSWKVSDEVERAFDIYKANLILMRESQKNPAASKEFLLDLATCAVVAERDAWRLALQQYPELTGDAYKYNSSTQEIVEEEMSRYEEEGGDMGVRESAGPTQDTATNSGSVVTISAAIEEGIGCILVAIAVAILLWALLAFGVPIFQSYGG